MPLERKLEVRDLRYFLALGCTAEERSRPQEVAVSVSFRFRDDLPAERTDDLADTICFAELNDALSRHFAAREYHLIERLGADAYAIARELARGKAGVAVIVHKLRPPVANLQGGAIYACGDFSA